MTQSAWKTVGVRGFVLALLLWSEPVFVSPPTVSSYCLRAKMWGVKGMQDFDACTLNYLWNSRTQEKKSLKLPALAGGFGGQHQVDEMIHFWMDFWKSQGLKLPVKDPLMVKSIIAVESAFRPTASPNVPHSSAYGLMQLTNQTREILAGESRGRGFPEVRHHRLHITRSDIENMNVNIASGIRWLAHKGEILPDHIHKNENNALKSYHSWDGQGEEYMRKVRDLYVESRFIHTLKTAQPLMLTGIGSAAFNARLLGRKPANTAQLKFSKSSIKKKKRI